MQDQENQVIAMVYILICSVNARERMLVSEGNINIVPLWKKLTSRETCKLVIIVAEKIK